MFLTIKEMLHFCVRWKYVLHKLFPQLWIYRLSSSSRFKSFINLPQGVKYFISYSNIKIMAVN